MIGFLFDCSRKMLRYSLANENMHKDDTLPQKLNQCLEAFVGFQESCRSTKTQTVKLMGGDASGPRKEIDSLHIVLASVIHDRSDLSSCNSVHMRAERLRCVLFILIDAGIVPLKRFTRQEIMSQTCQSLRASASQFVTRIRDTDPLMILLSALVFCLNSPLFWSMLTSLLVHCQYFHIG